MSTKLILFEIIVTIIAGSIPFFILLITNKDLPIDLIMKSLYPGDYVFNYLSILLLLHLLISALMKYLNPNKFPTNFLSTLHKISYQVGFSIHGIYRMIIGAIIVFVIYSIYKKGFEDYIQLLTIWFVVIYFIFGGFLIKLSEKTAPKN